MRSLNVSVTQPTTMEKQQTVDQRIGLVPSNNWSGCGGSIWAPLIIFGVAHMMPRQKRAETCKHLCGYCLIVARTLVLARCGASNIREYYPDEFPFLAPCNG